MGVLEARLADDDGSGNAADWEQWSGQVENSQPDLRLTGPNDRAMVQVGRVGLAGLNRGRFGTAGLDPRFETDRVAVAPREVPDMYTRRRVGWAALDQNAPPDRAA